MTQSFKPEQPVPRLMIVGSIVRIQNLPGGNSLVTGNSGFDDG